MIKKELRKQYKLKREKLTDFEITEFSEKIFNQFKSNFNFKGKAISVFLPIEEFKEVNTWLFLNDYPAQYFLPVVKPDDLVHIKFESLAQLKRTTWGILEPQFGQIVQANLFDVVLVPLLAYDVQGNRVGYGKGFYDRFLINCHPNCKFIGLSFFEPETEIIETIASDIRLHYCITPQTVHQFKNIIKTP